MPALTRIPYECEIVNIQKQKAGMGRLIVSNERDGTF